MKKISCYFWIIIVVVLCSCMIWAEKESTGVIVPGVYQTVAVTNHIPETFNDSNEYWDSRQKVELKIGGQDQFKDLPKLGMKQPYTGFIVLGDKPQKFAVIVDIVGNEKRLYIDTDGDNSFAKETWYPLLNEWYGLEIYSVESPEPITLQVSYNSKTNKTYPIEIAVGGYIFKPGPFINPKYKPSLLITVRTWFLGKLSEDGAEKLAAIVDRNNNGRFNDPEDAYYIDYNDDGMFGDNEMALRKSGLQLKTGKNEPAIDWEVYPETVTIGGKLK